MAKSNQPYAIEVEKYLKGFQFPATRKDFVDRASSNEGPGEVLTILQEMPEQDYDSPVEVAKVVSETK